MLAGGLSLLVRYPMSAFERLLVPGFTELPCVGAGKMEKYAHRKHQPITGKNRHTYPRLQLFCVPP
jgi:hypothetical protein